MQDDNSNYYSSRAFVYTSDHALEVAAIWRGVDALERRGVSLDAIERALTQDWETSVIALAQLGRRP
jgi:hypothetical protein